MDARTSVRSAFHNYFIGFRPRPLPYTFAFAAFNRFRSEFFQIRTAMPSIICAFGARTFPTEIQTCNVAREIPVILAASRVVILRIAHSIA